MNIFLVFFGLVFLCLEWMFLGMFFFLDWAWWIEGLILLSLAFAGWTCFKVGIPKYWRRRV